MVTEAHKKGGTRQRELPPTRNALPKFFTVAQVAELLTVSGKTVRRWIDRGLLAKHEFGSAVRISEIDLRTFIAMHRKA